MEALRQGIRKEMYAATQEATEQSFRDLQDNVRLFYGVPEGRYHRMKQLMNSPQLKEISFSGDTATGEIEIDTNSPSYNPSGRTVEEIYSYAEDDTLIGMGGFWQRTEEKIKDNVEDAFGKHFNK
ncbi:hypothetical protein FMM74_019670 [Lachnospiraceae bacterium MD308]|nr:hypothetical protein [Lachnospiraceae bacterium MD308]